MGECLVTAASDAAKDFNVCMVIAINKGRSYDDFNVGRDCVCVGDALPPDSPIGYEIKALLIYRTKHSLLTNTPL